MKRNESPRHICRIRSNSTNGFAAQYAAMATSSRSGYQGNGLAAVVLGNEGAGYGMLKIAELWRDHGVGWIPAHALIGIRPSELPLAMKLFCRHLRVVGDWKCGERARCHDGSATSSTDTRFQYCAAEIAKRSTPTHPCHHSSPFITRLAARRWRESAMPAKPNQSNCGGTKQQDIGASYNGKPGMCAWRRRWFSFYPTKNLGAYGDAG